MEFKGYRKAVIKTQPHNKYGIDPTRPTIPKNLFKDKQIRTSSITDEGWDIAGKLAKELNTSKSGVLELCLRYFERDQEEIIYFKDNYIKANGGAE